jgi:hypothetical protein
MESTFLLNVVVTESTSIFELLAGKDQTLLVGRNALLVLNLGFDGVNGVTRLDIQRNGLARECLYENLKRIYNIYLCGM